VSIVIEMPAPVVRDVSKAVRLAQNLGRVVLFTTSGRRASAALRGSLRVRRAATIVLRCQPTTTVHEILRRLARHFKAVPARSGSRISSADLYELLEKRLNDGATLLVLDRAHYLTNSAFGLLRDFYNDCRLPVLLVTDEVSAPAVQRRMSKYLTGRGMQYPHGG